MQIPSSPSGKHTRQIALKQIDLKFEFFELATEDTISGLIENLKVDEEKLTRLSRRMPEIEEQDYYSLDQEDRELIDEYSELYMNIDYTKEYLLSLVEMKIVYLFKSLVVLMKRIIQIAYPKSNTKDFFQWDNMKALFKSKVSKLQIWMDIVNVCNYGR